MFKKIVLISAFFILFASVVSIQPAYSGTQAVEYLCELGITFYKLGRYDEALQEFNKALMLEPANQTAKKYINNIFKQEIPSAKPEAKLIPSEKITKEPQKISAKKEEAMDKTLDKLSKKDLEEKAEKKTTEPAHKIAGLKISGETQLSLGMTPRDTIWKRANGDLNERNWRMLSEATYNRRENTYDPRIYDRLRVNLDTENDEGFNFHSNVAVDPWSFIGKSEKITVPSAWGDNAEVELKYWSNTGYTINENVYTNRLGNAFSLPEIKVEDKNTHSIGVSGAMVNEWGLSDRFTIPALKIHREFQPLRELWFDYTQPDLFKIRFFPIAYQDQALTSDDPLKLSNNHIWWEESPWLDRWLPGRLNSGVSPVDFSPGELDDSLSFFTRDSDGTRLTSLRGLSFEFTPDDKASLATTFASPKGLWQDYDSFDNLMNATRFKYYPLENLYLGSVYTYRLCFNEENKRDAYNHVWAVDLGYEPLEGVKLSSEVATSRTKQDLTSPDYATKWRGNAYNISLIGTFPSKSIMDLRYGYDEIKPEKKDTFFTKYRLYWGHMDWGFAPGLSNYIETRDDAFWSRHIHFRKPLEHWYAGLYYPSLKWEDIESFRIGNGIDIGRDAVGFRLENSLWDKKINNLFDVRNVHNTNGKFVENVARDEFTYKVTNKLTTKLLGIHHKLPKTKGGYDPFVVDGDTGVPLRNSAINDGQNVNLKTGSIGMEYVFTDWVALSGIWECTNDYNLAYDNFPRGNLNSLTFDTGIWYDRVYRVEDPYLYSQGLFPLPPYHFYDIFKTGLRFNPLKNLDIYLDYTRNEFKSAGQIDDNMNHIGLEVSYLPTKKLEVYLRYVYSRWNDLTLMRQGYSKYYLGHHNFFTEFRYSPTSDDELVMQYGESGRSPIATHTSDPFGGSLTTIDTQHIFRLYYRRKF